jgi:tetratricopeptide (TPR) repeat protein
MKHRIFLTLLLSASLFAQQPSTQSPPQQQQQTPPSGQQAPPAGQPGQPPAAQPAPVKPDKSKPMAKTDEEFNEYKAIIGSPDIKASVTAADAFAKKYPDSELRVPAYSVLMQKAYGANDADTTLEVAEKILATEPEHTIALVISSSVLAERTRETDLDRDERLSKSIERAEKAIKTIDTGLVVPPEITPEQLAGAKQQLVSMAHANMGYVELSKKNYPAAEKHFTESVETGKARPDATTYYRLALSQHGQKKFGDALKNATRAVELAQVEGNQLVLQLAQEEKSKLEKAK